MRSNANELMFDPDEKEDEEFLVNPFTVIVDSREQFPFQFKGLKTNADKKKIPLIIPKETRGLKTGDYSIEGFEDQIAIERKSKEDAFGTFISDRKRGMSQLQRLAELDHAFVVIECDWMSLRLGPDREGVSKTGRLNQGKSLCRSITAWLIDFPSVHWLFCPTRAIAEAQTFRILEKFWDRKVTKRRKQ